MNTIDFLKRVCPDRDAIVVTQYNNNKNIFWNREVFTYAELDDAAANMALWDKNPEATIYYSVGAFADNIVTTDEGKQKIRRTQDKATFFKSLCFDLDCGGDKPYKTQRDGLIKLAEVVKELKLPKPLIVSSGIGAHVYWVLDKCISKQQWVQVSKALSAALASKGLEIDNSKIHDPSMVLRPVGTFHKKTSDWKEVKVLLDDGIEHDVLLLAGKLTEWMDTTPQRPDRPQRKRSAMLDAVLNEGNDLDIDSIAEHCQQVRAIVESGGVTNAAGDPVEEPLWRASLGLAKFTPDPEQTIIRIAGQHPEFDLEKNMEKLEGWNATGPTTCATFALHCPKGCEACPYQGKKTSPAQLSSTDVQVVVVQDESGEEQEVEIPMPEGYVMRRDQIYHEIVVKDEDGNETKDWELTSTYPMYIESIYFSPEDRQTSFTLAIKKPLIGWEQNDHLAAVLSSAGKEFSGFLLDNQIFGLKSLNQQEKVRGYLMDYLQMVQSQVATGYDYKSFGWQKDGSFICGQQIINPPNNATSRRIVGNAERYKERIVVQGTREKFVEAMDMLNLAGTQVIRTCALISTTGIIAKQMGMGSSIVSVYSTDTTTGKTLSLLTVNSMFGNPRSLIQGRNDTTNAIYGMRGTLNNLPMAIDEITMADEHQVAQMAYSFSEGQEKTTMTPGRDIRHPAVWDGPTFMTTNTSLMSKFDQVKQESEPLRVRAFEVPQNDRTFVSLRDDSGGKVASNYADLLLENHGWAFPELVQAVVHLGGAKEVAAKGHADFHKTFGFDFAPQERFYESMIKSAWTMGKIGSKLGLFPFDVKDTIEFMLETVTKLRKDTVDAKVDAIDVIGQFMQQYNDQIIEVTQPYGKGGKPMVREPAPLKAVMRTQYVYDANNPIMPGSTLAINRAVFKKFVKENNDAEDRVLRELQNMGALVDSNARVTMFKNCRGRNPGQAWCILVNLNHPRFIDSLSGADFKKQSSVSLALLNGLQDASNG